MTIRLSLFASGLVAGSALLIPPAVHAADATPPNYGNSSGPGVPSAAAGATDRTGTGPDASLGVTHAQSSGPTRNGSTVSGNASGTRAEDYGTITGPGATRDTPGADDGTGTGPDASTGITHVQSGGGTRQPVPQPPPPANDSGGR